MIRTVSHIGALLIFAGFFSACAKQNSAGPSGGPADEDPPIVLEAEPPDKTTNFAASEFRVTFDEFFVLDNVTQKLMISPPFEKTPEVKTKGKTMIVSFEEALRDSVTYTFYFLDAIRDLNENNPIENFQYVFSTGPSIDSLSVTGTILNALSLDPGEDVFVMLYSDSNDTLPLTSLPEYITRATDDGKFRIDNIADGTYSIYGLTDLNGNKYYDLPDESFAFIDSIINLSAANNFIPSMPDSLTSAADSANYLKIPGKEYELFFFTSDKKDQYLRSTDRKMAYRLDFIFNLPVDSGQFTVEFPGFEDSRFLRQNSPGNDSITLWLLDSAMYSTQNLKVLTTYPQTDSTGSVVAQKDTLSFRYLAPGRPRGRTAEEEPALLITHNAGGRAGFKPGNKITFISDKPLDKIDASLLDLFLIADTSRYKMKYGLDIDSTHSNRAILSYSFIPDSSYVLSWNRGTFRDIFGNVNDSSGLKFTVRNKDSYGTLRMRLSGYTGSVILQLLSSDEKLIREDRLVLPDDNEVYYPLLEKGEYMLKTIFDLDGDGKWTTGNYETGRQPEPVTYYPARIEIKVQWDLEQDWELNTLNDKNASLKKK
ncbi:MAG: Ig-like domain-containing domain [Marinilabiliaceae bacterium]|nr:Ig-like domain-containing domain [Marinilabiliaceae bacterium]